MRLSDLAQICGAKLEGKPDHEIRDVAKIEAAGPEHVCFAVDKEYLPALQQSRAGAVITRPGIAVPAGMNALRAEDPDLAFSMAVEALRPEPPRPKPGVSDKAVIGTGAVIGEGASIGALAFIAERVQIGRNAVIYPHCYVGEGSIIGDGTVLFPGAKVMHECRIGKNCRILPGACIGADGFGFHFVAGKFVNAPQRGTVVIEDDVEIGANSTVDRARFDVTLIKTGTKIDNLVQIAHNCVVGRHCVIAGQAALSGSVTLHDYVQMGGNAGITPHVTIGMGTKIGAKTGVMRDIGPGQNIAGLVGDDGRTWMKREAAVRRLPETMEKIRRMQATVAKLAELAGLPVKKPGE